MNDPAAHLPPWEWNITTIRALMKVRGDSAHSLAKDLYIVPRAVEGWLYNNRCPNPTSAKQLYRLWAQLDPWQREVFDALRANPPSAERPRSAALVPTLDPPAATPTNGDGTDRGQFCKLIVGGLASAPLEALERIAADLRRPGRIDTGLITAHEHWADLLASQHYTQRSDVLAGPTAQHADTLLALLDRPMPDTARQRLDAITVGVCGQAGLLAWNLDNRMIAYRYFTHARDVADDAGSARLRAQATAVTSALYSPIPTAGLKGDTRSATALLQAAVGHDGTLAWTHWWLATELAAGKYERDFFESVEAAERLSEHSPQGDGRGFFERFTVGPMEVSANIGAGLALLGRADEAMEELRAGLALPWPRVRVMLLGHAATARRLQGEPEEASAGLTKALGIALATGYIMGIERIFGVRAKFDPKWNDLACVRELDDRLRAILA